MVAEINSGSIFWLLPLNIVLMSMSMYNIEIVSQAGRYFKTKNLSCFHFLCIINIVTVGFGELIIPIDLYGVFIDLAFFALPLRYLAYR